MEDEARNFIKLWLTAIASLCYCYLISSNLPEKKLRFLFLLPLFSIFTFFPFTLSAADPTGVPTFFFFCSWLANFKLLFCSFGTGLLTVSVAQHSFSMFAPSLATQSYSGHKSRPASQKPKPPPSCSMIWRPSCSYFCSTHCRPRLEISTLLRV